MKKVIRTLVVASIITTSSLTTFAATASQFVQASESVNSNVKLSSDHSSFLYSKFLENGAENYGLHWR